MVVVACLYASANVNPGLCPTTAAECCLCMLTAPGCRRRVCCARGVCCVCLWRLCFGFCFGLGSSRMARRNCSSLLWEELGARLVRLSCLPLLQGTSYLAMKELSRLAQAILSRAKSAHALPAVSLSCRSMSMKALKRVACLIRTPAAFCSSHHARLRQQKISLPMGSPPADMADGGPNLGQDKAGPSRSPLWKRASRQRRKLLLFQVAHSSVGCLLSPSIVRICASWTVLTAFKRLVWQGHVWHAQRVGACRGGKPLM